MRIRIVTTCARHCSLHGSCLGGVDPLPPVCCSRLHSLIGAPRVNTVKYNRFHDQLLVSGSSDCMVHLWRVSSVSSAPLLEPEDEDAGGLDGADGGEFGGSGGGSKGEAADIRVRVVYMYLACEIRTRDRPTKLVCHHSPRRPPPQLVALALAVLCFPPAFARSTRVCAVRRRGAYMPTPGCTSYIHCLLLVLRLSRPPDFLLCSHASPRLQVRTFDEHEESVYSLAWSASDAWVLASLSYDGLVVLNHVPSTEKYKILL